MTAQLVQNMEGCPVGAMCKMVNPAIGCRRRVQSGWQVSVISNTTTSDGQPLTTYHVNHLGTDYRVILVLHRFE